MALYKAEGLVLRTRDWGEADRIVTLLSPARGKIKLMAKGARRPRNRLAAGTQLFSYVEIMAAEGTGLHTLSQCEIKDSFRDLRDDFEKMAYGAYIAELVDELVPESEPDELVFALVLQLFNLLRRRNPRIVAVIASLKLLSRAGYRPQLDNCVHCGRPEQGERMLFSSVLGGMLCAKCSAADAGAIWTVPATLAWLERLTGLNATAPEEFSLSLAVLKELETISGKYIQHCLEKELKTDKFLAGLRD